MKKTIINVLLFTAGAAIGSLVTWKVVKSRYERILEEEIESVKATWTRMSREESADDNVELEKEDDKEEDDDSDDGYVSPFLSRYHELAGKYKKPEENDEEGGVGGVDEVPYVNGPYVISPDDYGDGNYDHDCYCLSYYSDGVLSNDWYEEIDIDETIGEESLNHFGEYAEDILHVRNERLKADYEIVRDYRNYSDLLANDPHIRMHAN